MQLNATYRGIWQLAYPIILGSLAQNLIGVTDIILLGRVGETELGASGIMSIYYLAMVMVGFAISRGGQILIARRTGQGLYDEVGSIVYNLFVLMMGTAAVIFLFLMLVSPWLIHFFIHSSEVYNAGMDYLFYRSFGIFFSFFGFVLMSLYTGIGRTKIIALVTALLFLSNLIFNYVLVFGKLGFPAMGISGSGLASTLAEIFSTIAGIAFMAMDKNLHKFNLFQRHPIRMPLQRQLCILAAPMVLQYLVGLGGWFLFFALIEGMGKRALSASTVLKNVYTLYSIPAWGFASAANAVVSNLIGQHKYKQVYIAINRTAILSFMMTILPCTLLMMFPGSILAAFTNEPEVIATAQPILFILVGALTASAIGTVVFNGMMGTGATLLSLLIEFLGVAAYLSYAYGVVNLMNLGLPYVWVSEFIYWVLLAVLSWYYLQTGKWRHLKV